MPGCVRAALCASDQPQWRLIPLLFAPPPQQRLPAPSCHPGMHLPQSEASPPSHLAPQVACLIPGSPGHRLVQHRHMGATLRPYTETGRASGVWAWPYLGNETEPKLQPQLFGWRLRGLRLIHCVPLFTLAAILLGLLRTIARATGFVLRLVRSCVRGLLMLHPAVLGALILLKSARRLRMFGMRHLGMPLERGGANPAGCSPHRPPAAEAMVPTPRAHDHRILPRS
jgi:hypothetical protein